jgi:hypothetical protein
MLIWHASHIKSGAIPQSSCCCCDALAPRIIPTPSNDDFQGPSPKPFNAGQAGPKYTFYGLNQQENLLFKTILYNYITCYDGK